MLIGLGASIVVIAAFAYPSRVYPIQSLGFAALALILALGAGVMARVDRVIARAPLGAWTLLAAAGIAGWSLLGWTTMELEWGGAQAVNDHLPAAGWPVVLGYLMVPAAVALGLSLSLLESPDEPKGWPLFLRAAALAGLGFSALGIYQYTIGFERSLGQLPDYLDPHIRESMEHALLQREIGGRLGPRNLFAASLAFLGALGLSQWSPHSPRLWRGISAAAFIMCGVTVLLTGSRGGGLTFIAATAGGIAILAKLYRMDGARPNSNAEAARGSIEKPKSRAASGPLARLALALALGSIATAAFAQGLADRLSNVSTIRERLNYWDISIRLWAEHPITGAGPGGFMLHYPSLKPPSARESRSAHSWIFHSLAESGVVGLAVFVLFMGLVAYAWFRLWRRADKPVARSGLWLGLGFAAFVFNGLFEYTLQAREFLMVFGLLGGGVVGAWMAVGSNERREKASGARPLARGLAMGSIGSVIALSAWAMVIMPRYHAATFWEWEARAMSQAGEHELARDYYERASRWLPGQEGFLVARAMAAAQSPGGGPEAIAMIERAERMNPRSARLRQLHARQLRAAGRLDEALTQYDGAIERYPHDAGHRIERAEARLEAGQTDKALEDLRFIDEKDLPVWKSLRPRLKALRQTLEAPPAP